MSFDGVYRLCQCQSFQLAKALLQLRNYAIMAGLEPRLPECVPGALPTEPPLCEPIAHPAGTRQDRGMARPRFNPTPCKPTTYGNTNVTWTPIITCPADFPASLVRTSFPHCPTSFAQFRVGVPSSLKKITSAAVRTCHLPAYPPPRVQLDAHTAIRSHRRLRRRVSRRPPGPRRTTADPEHTSQAPPTSPDARRRTRAALHALRAFAFAFAITSSDR